MDPTIGNLKPGERNVLLKLRDEKKKELSKADEELNVAHDKIVDILRESPSVAEEILLKRINSRTPGTVDLPDEMDVEKSLIDRGIYKLGTGPHHITQVNSPSRPSPLDSVLIKIQNVHDYFVAHAKEHGWEDLNSFFAVRPPFPKMVFSYDSNFFNRRLGKKIVRHVDVIMTERGMDYFAHYFKHEAHIAADQCDELQALVVRLRPFRFLEFQLAMDGSRVPGRWFVMTDEKGKVLTEANIGWVFVKDPKEDALLNKATQLEGIDMQEMVQDAFGSHGSCALAALQFMNCKNVEVVDNLPTRQQRRSAERENKRPPVTYKTLIIHPTWKKKRNVSSSSTGVEMSLHICRGHFKDYREGDGLGRAHVKGMWWWSPQVRGSAERGRVVKDYEVETEP
jgi:hypothetical protein